MPVTVTVTADRLAKLDAMILTYGSHPSVDAGTCAMEMVAYLANEPHSDHPKCACPVITRMLISANDRMQSDEERGTWLKPILPFVVGTRSTRAVELRRVYMAADWSVRWAAPFALRAVGRDDLADRLAALPRIADAASASEAAREAKEVRRIAHAAAYDAAYADAAYAAYADAAYAAAAHAAAADAAYVDAAHAHAHAAAAAYADAAAYVDAYAAFKAIREQHRATVWSAFGDLVSEMCAVTE
jgi:hypothetical protein